MPTTPIRRVRLIVTGVAGAPYYLTGYFDAAVGTATQNVTEWKNLFLASSGDLPIGATLSGTQDVQVIDPVTGQITGTEPAPLSPINGTNNGSLMPPSQQILVRFRTGLYIEGRQLQGRTNVPARFQSEITATGQLLPASQTAYQLRANTLVSSSIARLVIYSKPRPAALTKPAHVGYWAPVTSASVWNQFAVLRSRRD